MAWFGAVRHLQRGANQLAPSGLSSFDRSAQALIQLKINNVLPRKWNSVTSTRTRLGGFDNLSQLDGDDDLEFQDLGKLSRQGVGEQDREVFMPESVQSCDACKAPREEVVCHCEVCDEYLCSLCDQTKHGLSLNSLLSSSPETDETDDHQRTYFDKAPQLKQEELDEVNKFFAGDSVLQKSQADEASLHFDDPDYREIRDFLYPALSLSAAASTSAAAISHQVGSSSASSIPTTAVSNHSDIPNSPVPTSLLSGGFAIPAAPVRQPHSIALTLPGVANNSLAASLTVSPFSDHSFVHRTKRGGVAPEPGDRMMMPQSPIQPRSRRHSLSFPFSSIPVAPSSTPSASPSSSASSLTTTASTQQQTAPTQQHTATLPTAQTTTTKSSSSRTSPPVSPFVPENDSFEQMVQYERAYQAAYEQKAAAAAAQAAAAAATTQQVQQQPSRKSISPPLTTNTHANTSSPVTLMMNKPSPSSTPRRLSQHTILPQTAFAQPQPQTHSTTPSTTTTPNKFSTPLPTRTITPVYRSPSINGNRTVSSSASRPQGRPANKSRPVRAQQQPVTHSSHIPQITEQRYQQLQEATLRAHQPKPRGRPPKSAQLQRQQQQLLLQQQQQQQQLLQQQQQLQQLQNNSGLPSAFSALSIHSSSSSPDALGMQHHHLPTKQKKARSRKMNQNDDDMSQSDSDGEPLSDDLTSNAAQAIARNLVGWRDSFELVEEQISPSVDTSSRLREYSSREPDATFAAPKAAHHQSRRYHPASHRRDQSASPRSSVVAAPAIIHPASLVDSNPFATLLVLCSDNANANGTTSPTTVANATTSSSVTTTLGHQMTAFEVMEASHSRTPTSSPVETVQSVMEGAIEAATTAAFEPQAAQPQQSSSQTNAAQQNANNTAPYSYQTYPYSLSANSSAPIISTSSIGDASYNFVTQFAYPYTTTPDFSPINNIMADATVPEYYETPTPANTNPSFFIV